MKITTKNLWLRPIKESDRERLREWRNEYREWFFSDDGKEITQERQEKWFKKYTSLPSGTDMMFIATKLGTQEEIGTIALYNVNMDERTAIMGRVLVLKQYLGHNYSQEMVDAIRDLSFDTMRLHRLIAETDLTNTKAQHIYFTAGFRTVGQRFIQSTRYLFRIVVTLEIVNPDHDTNKPLRLVNL